MPLPLVEKYRPTCFDSILLTPQNRAIFQTILRQNQVPNLLLYGPPGTGKTTTIINLIAEFQRRNQESNRGLVLHLNASDDRGIDTIRTQIATFVKANTFWGGTKFIVFDEVDSMTKPAQQALSYILQEGPSVCFCLMCNYICKIDDLLQDHFVKIKFNHLPDQDVIDRLISIAHKEGVNINVSDADHIRQYFGSDVRSMINFLHTGVNRVVTGAELTALYELVEAKDNINTIKCRFMQCSQLHNMDPMTLLNDFVYFVFTKKRIKGLDKLKLAFHTPNADPMHVITFVFLILLDQ
jgi:DNA polymerase III delta prime subunit